MVGWWTGLDFRVSGKEVETVRFCLDRVVVED